jgi:plasmid stability protein
MSDAGYPSDRQDRFIMRLPDGMRDEIKERARKAGRSMNAEIVQILSAALNHEIQGDDDMARGDAELRIRIPHNLRDGVKSKASEANRTMNGEIVLALQAHLDEPGGSRNDHRMMLAGQALNGFLASRNGPNLWSGSVLQEEGSENLVFNCVRLADMLIEEAGQP